MRRFKVDAECDNMARIDRRFRKKGQMIRMPAKCDRKRQKAAKLRNYSKAQIRKYGSIFVRHGSSWQGPTILRSYRSRGDRDAARLAQMLKDNQPHRLLFIQGVLMSRDQERLARFSSHLPSLLRRAEKIEQDKDDVERDEKAREMAEDLMQQHALQTDGSVMISSSSLLAIKQEYSNMFLKLVLGHLSSPTLFALIKFLRNKLQEKQVSKLAQSDVIAAEIPEGKETEARLYVNGASPPELETTTAPQSQKPWEKTTARVLEKKQNSGVIVSGRFDLLSEDIGLETSFDHQKSASTSTSTSSGDIKWTESEIDQQNEWLLNVCSGDPLSTALLREEITRKIFWLSLPSHSEGREVISEEKSSRSDRDNWRKKSPPTSSTSSPKNNVNNVSSVSENVSNIAATASASPFLITATSQDSPAPLFPSSFALFTKPELPKNMPSLLISVFNDTQLFQLRPLNADERRHARLTDRVQSNEPDPYNMRKPAPCGRSIVQSMQQFEFNFDTFSYGMLRGVNLTRAVISGGAVLGCMLPVHSHHSRWCTSYYALRREAMTALDMLPNALFQLVDSYAMIGHKEWENMAKYYSDVQTWDCGYPFWNSDIDIFVCAETEQEGLEAIASIASAVASNIPSKIPHCFIRTTNAITVVSSHPYRHVQVILMLNRSVEEVLLGADMDCTAVGFTGATGSFLSVGAMPLSASPKQVVCLPRFMRAMNTRHNFMDFARFSRSNMPCRLEKYFTRGFSLLLFDICEHDKRCDVVVPMEVTQQLVAVQEADPTRPLLRYQRRPLSAYPDMQIPYGEGITARVIAQSMSTGEIARREILKQWGSAPYAENFTVQEALKEFKLPWVVADHLHEVMPELVGVVSMKKAGPTAALLAEISTQEQEARRHRRYTRGGRLVGRSRGGYGGIASLPPKYARYEVGDEARDITVSFEEKASDEEQQQQVEIPEMEVMHCTDENVLIETEEAAETEEADRAKAEGQALGTTETEEATATVTEQKISQKTDVTELETENKVEAQSETKKEEDDIKTKVEEVEEVEVVAEIKVEAEAEAEAGIEGTWFDGYIFNEEKYNTVFAKWSKMPTPYLTKGGMFELDKLEGNAHYLAWENSSRSYQPNLTQQHKWGAARMCPYEGLTHLPCVRFKKDELIRTGVANEFIPPCYVCLERFTPQGGMGGVRGALACRLCPNCVRVEEEKISARVDLRGRVGLVTGGRTKIGLCIALKLLRCGALVIVTTRFPQNAMLRYKEQPDWDSFKSRLHVYGLDMRALPSVNEFLTHVMRFYCRLDFLINNAAQTVRRPPAYYRGMFEVERSAKLMAPEMKMVSENPFLERLTAPESLSGALALHSVAGDLKAFGTSNASNSQDLAYKLGVPVSFLSAALPLVPLLPSDAPSETDAEVFPVGQTDRDGEPLDLRPNTSWTSTISSVPLLEVMETQLVNSIVPFSFISTLEPLLRSNAPLDSFTPKRCNRFVVNVSAREGQFGGKPEKLNTHPHTNMAKASLNMLTRTVAGEMAANKIFVTAVDTGWVSRMRPGQPKLRSVEPPLSNEAGAARVLDPIFSFLDHASPPHGVFLQNYQVADW